MRGAELSLSDLKFPPITEEYRWKVTRTPGDIVTSPGWTVALQKRRFFWWTTVAYAWANIHEGEAAIQEAGKKAFLRYFEYENAADYEGIINGNSEYRQQ